MRTDDLLGAIWLPGDGKVNPTDLTQSLARGARQRGAAGRRGRAGDGLRHRGGPDRTPGDRRTHGPRRRRGRGRRHLRRAVVQGARRPRRRDRPPALGRALLRRHRRGRGHPPRPADACATPTAGPTSRRRSAASSSAGSSPRRSPGSPRPSSRTRSSSQLLEEDWEHFSVLMDAGRPPGPGARAHRDPQVLQRPRELHARQPVPDRARLPGCAASSSARASTRSASPRPAAPAGPWPSGSSPASRPATWSRSTCAGSRRTPATTRGCASAWSEMLGIHYAVPWPRPRARDRPRRTPVAAARPARRRRGPSSAPRWGGSGSTSSAREPGESLVGPALVVRRVRRRAGGLPHRGRGLRPDVVLEVRRRPAPTPWPGCSGSAPPTSTCRSGPASTRRCSTRAAPTRPTSP